MGLVTLALCLLSTIVVLSFRRGDRRRNLIYCSMVIAWHIALEIVYYFYGVAEKDKLNIKDEQLSNSESYMDPLTLAAFIVLRLVAHPFIMYYHTGQPRYKIYGYLLIIWLLSALPLTGCAYSGWSHMIELVSEIEGGHGNLFGVAIISVLMVFLGFIGFHVVRYTFSLQDEYLAKLRREVPEEYADLFN